MVLGMNSTIIVARRPQETTRLIRGAPSDMGPERANEHFFCY